MADVIRGFNIELGLDTAGVDRGLSGLNRTMTRVNSEFSRSLSAFDRGERSIDRYDTTLQGLNSKMEVQEKIVGENRRAYQNLSKEYDTNRKALDKTSGELTSAEREMDRLMQSTDATAEEFVQAETALREAETAFAELNDEVTKNRTELDNAEVSLNRAERDYNKLANSVEYYTEEMKQMHIEQSIAESNWTKSGDAVIGFSNGLERVSGVATTVGDSLTRNITMPALGVVTAVGGITAAFGWGRLVDIDTAQAQLRGLGYETEDVERISNQLTDALEGGMLTMGEATTAAATAMAAGVEEGEELTRYIQILDGAVAGSNGTFQEMEQIFARVIDQGNLTRNEFDMISQRMPGFSAAIQDNLGVSSEAMYEMLRDGEITTEQFLDVMDEFAGDMATEYAKSWEGMMQNTKAYVGILGQSLLEGVFQESKLSVEEFIELLKSDEAQEWARETGEVLRETFIQVKDSVEDVVEWYQELDDWQQELLWKAGLFAVAIGPVLSVFGRLGGALATVGKGFGGLLKAIGIKSGTGKALLSFGGIASSTGGKVGTAAAGTGLVGKLGGLSGILGALGGPVGIAAAALGTTLVGGLIVAYNKSESFKAIVDEIVTLTGEGLVNSLEAAWEGLSWLGEETGNLVDWMVGDLETLGGETVTFTESVGRGWDRVSGFMSDTWDNTVNFFDGFYEEHMKGQETIEGFSDVVSEETQAMIEDYAEFSEEAYASLEELWSSQDELTAEQIEQLKEDYDTMHTEAKDRLEERKISELTQTAERLEGIKTLTDQDKENILTDLETHYNTEETMLDEKHQRIQDVIENEFETNGEITDEGYAAIQRIQEDHNIATADNLSESEIEQEAIMGRIKNNNTAISQEMTSEMVKDSIEAKERTIEEAKEKRDKTVEWAIDQYENHGTISEDQKNAIITGAELEYSETTRLAEDRHDDVLDWASEQAREHGIIVDRETGEILSTWEVFKRNFGTIFSTLSSTAWTRSKEIGRNIANGVIDGINWLREQFNKIPEALGISFRLPPMRTVGSTNRGHSQGRVGPGGNQAISPYSSGTDYHKGGHALLGDKGPGNSIGGSASNTAEIVELPDKKRYMVDGNVIWPDFPQGAKVQSNQESKEELDRLYAYNPDLTSVGSGMDLLMPNIYSPSVSGSNKVAKVSHSFGSMIDDIYEYMDDPAALINRLIGESSFSGIRAVTELGSGMVNSLSSGMIDKVKELFEQSSSTGDGSHILGKPITAHFGRYPAGINFNNGIHYGLDTHHVFDPLLSPINGIVDRVWNDFGGGLSMQVKAGRDYWWFMHLSNVMKSVGDSVTAGMRIATTGNSGNWTTGAHLHTQYMPGAPGNLNAEDPLPKLRNLGSYENGGLINQHGYFEGAEGNKPEMILPLTNRSRSIELMMEALSYMGGGQQSGNSDNVIKILIEEVKSLKEIIRLLGTEQNKLSLQLLESSRVIEKKENVVFIKDMIDGINKYKDDRTLAI